MSIMADLLGSGGSGEPVPGRRMFVGDGMLHKVGSRTCAGCDLCCTAMGVEEIEKGMGERCRHLTGEPGRSCGIYADRPPSCLTFACLWVREEHVLPDDMNPALCGFVVAHIPQRQTDQAQMFTVYPDPERPDAWRRPRYLNQLKRLARITNIMVVIGAGDGARAVISPRGSILSRANRPDLFPGGLTVGCPREEYR